MHCKRKSLPVVRLLSPTKRDSASSQCKENVNLSLTGDGLSNGETISTRELPDTDLRPPSCRQMLGNHYQQKPAHSFLSVATLRHSVPQAKMPKLSGCSDYLGLRAAKTVKSTSFFLEPALRPSLRSAEARPNVSRGGPLKPHCNVMVEEQGRRQSVRNNEQFTVATNTGYFLLPPWAAVHVGSHDLTECPTQATRVSSAAGPAFVSVLNKPRRSDQRASLVASRYLIAPRKRTLTTFREWLAEDHRHSRKAWGPSGQFPARRGLSHSATTERSRCILTAAATQRSAVETRARHAVEAEVRELSTNKTPQQQQEAYVSAQKEALAAQQQDQQIVDEAEAREEARAAAAAAAAAAASAAIAQAQWPSRHKARQQELEQMHRQEAKEKHRSAVRSACDRRPPSIANRPSSRPKSIVPSAKGEANQKSSRAAQRHLGASAASTLEPAPSAPAGKAKHSVSSPPAPSITKFHRSGKHQSSVLPSRVNLKQQSAQRRQRDPTSRFEEQSAHLDSSEKSSQGSADEEDSHPFNPLEEVMVLLRKLKTTENYSLDIGRKKRGVGKARKGPNNGPQMGQSFPATLETVSTTVQAIEVSNKLIVGLATTEREGRPEHERYNHESGKSHHALSDLKNLPLEAFDIPEDYGEASPQALLERCRSECQLRRLEMRHQKSELPKNKSSGRSASYTVATHVSANNPYPPPKLEDDPICNNDEAAVGLEVQLKEKQLMADASQGEATSTGKPAESEADQASPPSQLPEMLPEIAPSLGELTASAAKSSEGEAEAEVLHFVGNSWTHIPCIVLGYDSGQRRFEVKLRDGTIKTVRRLALRFCFEPPQLQQQRLEACTNRRRQAVLRQQLLNSVNSLPSSAFAPLPQNFLASIVKAATAVGRLRSMSSHMDTLRPAIQYLKDRFLEGSKLSAVLYCAERLRASGKLESISAKQQQGLQNQDLRQEEALQGPPLLLQVLQPMFSPAPPAFGRLNVGASAAFEGAMLALRKKPLFANEKTFKVGNEAMCSS